MAKKKRASLSKRTRFEVFKRDGFRCIYCGCSPVEKSLRVDHVVPVVEGGPDTSDNLVTSCFDCNAGKAGVRLERKALAPAIATEADKDHAEQIREYLRIQKEIEAARNDAVNVMAGAWEERVGLMSQDMFNRFDKLMREWPTETLIEAMTITGRRHGSVGRGFTPSWAKTQTKYFHGILRNWRTEGR